MLAQEEEQEAQQNLNMLVGMPTSTPKRPATLRAPTFKDRMTRALASKDDVRDYKCGACNAYARAMPGTCAMCNMKRLHSSHCCLLKVYWSATQKLLPGNAVQHLRSSNQDHGMRSFVIRACWHRSAGT